MVRTRQQESETFAPTQQQAQGPTQNNHFSTIEEEAETQRLTHVEKNIDAVRAIMEWMDAALMHLRQWVNSWAPQKPEAQFGPSNRRGAHKSRQTNDKYRQRVERSLQYSVSVNTRRNEVTSGQRASASQQSGENPKVLRTSCKGKNSRPE